jgi:hypothetical protein
MSVMRSASTPTSAIAAIVASSTLARRWSALEAVAMTC